MSLIHRSPISARQQAANRLNARKSTGPRTQEGKKNSQFNGLKHGLCAQPFRRVMSELGEDPEEFDRFHEGLREAAEPANTLEAQLVEDLAVLWWKKRRSERAQAGVQVREVERLQLARQRELHTAERLAVDQSSEESREKGLRCAPDSRGKFQMVLGSLDELIACLERNRGWREGNHTLADLYGQKPTVRGGMLWGLFWELCAADSSGQEGQASDGERPAPEGEGNGPSQGADAAQPAVEASAGAKPPGPEASRAFVLRAELVRLLLEERREVAAEYELFRREHAEVSAAAADACLAPTDQRWTWILRQDNYLDRQLERKIRLLDMLQERRRKRQAAAQAPESPAPPPPYTKMQARTHQVVENTRRRPWAEPRERPQRRPAAADLDLRGGPAGLEKGGAGHAELACGPGG